MKQAKRKRKKKPIKVGMPPGWEERAECYWVARVASPSPMSVADWHYVIRLPISKKPKRKGVT